jgi:hypothetical protein
MAAIGVVLRPTHDFKELRRSIAEIFHAPVSDVAELSDTDVTAQQARIVIELQEAAGDDFRLDVQVFMPDDTRGPRSDHELARALAPLIQDDVLASLPASDSRAANPFLWLLVRPDGRAFLVRQRPDQDPDLVLDSGFMEPWDGPDHGASSGT